MQSCFFSAFILCELGTRKQRQSSVHARANRYGDLPVVASVGTHRSRPRTLACSVPGLLWRGKRHPEFGMPEKLRKLSTCSIRLSAPLQVTLRASPFSHLHMSSSAMDATPPRGCEKEGEEMVNALVNSFSFWPDKTGRE